MGIVWSIFSREGEGEEKTIEAPSIQEEKSLEGDGVLIDSSLYIHSNESASQTSGICASESSNDCIDQLNNFVNTPAPASTLTPVAFTQNINSCNSEVFAYQIGNAQNINLKYVEVRNEHKSKREKCNFEELSEDLVNKDIVDFISKRIGYDWKRLARQLGIDEKIIEKLDHDKNYTLSLQEIIFSMLKEWCQSNKNDATIGKLASALKEIDHNDLVERLQSHLELENNS